MACRRRAEHESLRGGAAVVGDTIERIRHQKGTVGHVQINRRLVTVVDDDESVRESLPDLLRDFGFATQTFPSAEAFLEHDAIAQTSCLILDVRLPGLNGPDLHQELLRRGHRIPTIFITAQGDLSLKPRLIARGAVACLFKPFGDTALLDALTTALGTNADGTGPKE
jgi:FixJ family two-component response regulator